MKKKRIILIIAIAIIIIIMVLISILLYKHSKIEDPTSKYGEIYFDGENYLPVTGWLPLDIGTAMQTTERSKPQLTDVERVNKKKIKFKVQWDKVYYKYDLADYYEIEYALNDEFKNAKTKTIRETEKIKNAKKYITIRGLEKDKTYYVRIRGYMDYGDRIEEIHYTEWSDIYKIEP